jgi:ornithine carbamoyltransferase
MSIELAYPEGYDLIPEIVEVAKRNAQLSGGSFRVSHSMTDAMRDAEIVYPKSWAPFNIVQQRTQLLKEGDKTGLQDLEQKCLANNAKFMDWEFNESVQQLTRNKSALYMHCLPADISGVSCKKGEVSAEVFEHSRIKTYLEAGFKPYIIAAMMFTNKFRDPAEILKCILERHRNRVGLSL